MIKRMRKRLLSALLLLALAACGYDYKGGYLVTVDGRTVNCKKMYVHHTSTVHVTCDGVRYVNPAEYKAETD